MIPYLNLAPPTETVLGLGWFFQHVWNELSTPAAAADLLINLIATFVSVPLLVVAGVLLHSRKLRKHYVAALMKTFGLSRAEAIGALRYVPQDSRAGSLGSIIARGVNLRDETDTLRAYLKDLAEKRTGQTDSGANPLLHPNFSAFYDNLTNAFASCWILRSRYSEYRSQADSRYH